jgi:hypothetical protein
MKRPEHFSRRTACFAALALAAWIVIRDGAVFAQGTSEKPIPQSTPEVLQKTSVTGPDGLTTTTTKTQVMTPGRFRGAIITTVVAITDKDHNIQSEVTTTLDRSQFDISVLTTDTKKYNPLGGYSETIDSTREPLSGLPADSRGMDLDAGIITTVHEELTCDAAGNVLSGTRVTGGSSLLGGGPERRPLTPRKYTWDATAKTWTSSEGASWKPVQPDTSTAVNATEQVIAPPVASPGKQMMVAYRDPPDGPAGTSVAAHLMSMAQNLFGEYVKPGELRMYEQAAAEDQGYGWTYSFVDVPANATSVSVFKGFDGNGNPDAHASVTKVSSDAPVPGMLSLPGTQPPAGQPAIVASSGAYDVRAGTITVQTQNTSVADTLLLETGQPLTTLAASDRSMVAALPTNISLGRHQLSLEQLLAPQSVYPETVPFDAISLTVDPMPPVEEVGDTATPTVHVMGMPAGDAAVMEFLIGGSAELAGGGTFTSVPVVGNVASCTIVGVRSGEALVRFHLRLVSMTATPQ